MRSKTILITIALPLIAGIVAGLGVMKSADPTSAYLLLLIATPLVVAVIYRRSWWAAPLFTLAAFGSFTDVVLQRASTGSSSDFLFLIWLFSMQSIVFSVLVSFCIKGIRVGSTSK